VSHSFLRTKLPTLSYVFNILQTNYTTVRRFMGPVYCKPQIFLTRHVRDCVAAAWIERASCCCKKVVVTKDSRNIRDELKTKRISACVLVESFFYASYTQKAADLFSMQTVFKCMSYE
jgi:hypothetical protein